MVTKEETAKILGVCMDVFHELGSGFLEPVYQDAAEIAFRQAGIPFVREAQCPIYFRGVKINRNYEADFVCYGEVILEFKAVKCFAPEHKAQLINYLKATRIPLGYLINFHGERLTWERIVYTPGGCEIYPVKPRNMSETSSCLRSFLNPVKTFLHF